MNFPIAHLLNFVSIVTLLVLFSWSARNTFRNDDGGYQWKDNEGNWQFDMGGEEEREVEKILVDLGFLLISNFFVLAKTCKVSNRNYDRIDVGGLAGCTFMFANMMFISFWYMLNIQSRNGEGEEDNQNNQNNYNYWDMGDEERQVYNQSVVAYVSLALGLLYLITSFSVYCEGVSMQDHPDDSNAWQTLTELEIAKGAIRLDMLSHMWMFLAPTTVVTLLILLVVSACSLLGEEGDRLKDEGRIFNLIAVLAWLLVISCGLAVVGHRVLGRRSSDGTLGVGLLAGGGGYFSGSLLLVFILYFSPLLRDRGLEDGPLAATVTAFACLLLALLHIGFVVWTKKYKRSISSAIPIEEEDNSYVGHDDDFVRVDRGENELA